MRIQEKNGSRIHYRIGFCGWGGGGGREGWIVFLYGFSYNVSFLILIPWLSRRSGEASSLLDANLGYS